MTMSEASTERALGQVEGELRGIRSTLVQINERLASAEYARDEMRNDIGTLKEHADAMIIVAQQFNSLQQAIRDGKNQAKGLSKGIGMGIAIAAASGGAAVASIGKEVWKFFFG